MNEYDAVTKKAKKIILQKLREQQNLSIEDLADKTNVSIEFIKKIEENSYDKFLIVFIEELEKLRNFFHIEFIDFIQEETLKKKKYLKIFQIHVMLNEDEKERVAIREFRGLKQFRSAIKKYEDAMCDKEIQSFEFEGIFIEKRMKPHIRVSAYYEEIENETEEIEFLFEDEVM